MNVKELIRVLEKVEHKEAKVIFRCTDCDRCNQVQDVYVRHDLVNEEIVVMMEEEC